MPSWAREDNRKWSKLRVLFCKKIRSCPLSSPLRTKWINLLILKLVTEPLLYIYVLETLWIITLLFLIVTLSNYKPHVYKHLFDIDFLTIFDRWGRLYRTYSKNSSFWGKIFPGASHIKICIYIKRYYYSLGSCTGAFRIRFFSINRTFLTASKCHKNNGHSTPCSHYGPMSSSNTLTIVDTTFFFSKEIQRVHAITRNETLKPSQTTTNQPSRVPLVITHNPSLRSISSIIQKHFKILSSSPPCNNIFQTTPLVAFRRTDNLSDILVRSKLRTDKQTDVTKGSFRCGKNCITRLPLYHRRLYKLYLFCHWGNQNHLWLYRLQL